MPSAIVSVTPNKASTKRNFLTQGRCKNELTPMELGGVVAMVYVVRVRQPSRLLSRGGYIEAQTAKGPPSPYAVPNSKATMEYLMTGTINIAQMTLVERSDGSADQQRRRDAMNSRGHSAEHVLARRSWSRSGKDSVERVERRRADVCPSKPGGSVLSSRR